MQSNRLSFYLIVLLIPSIELSQRKSTASINTTSSNDDDEFEMPDKLVPMLVRFLEQNGGTLSKRTSTKNFQN